ncbi:CoA transferase [Saccharopolyspora phatthalungensis]|uniref:Crotonobetainyl-CoA:carnitine CoA-transferase CaiB-like acyl-CoA transferase n=1 Tax=Saccharopolyspora phatthalungensis TaxID=664693 RepID=A0A840QKC6_9PSEU|nr:CoA transferase [Saccharopolyspora phatthalungensis]MBB5158783.1 crotonobetainyl-CoA:carnitine CoA-transferase CaiB-like acyl-CoA transferase [Saccharopolyspora phatthalungensis]
MTLSVARVESAVAAQVAARALDQVDDPAVHGVGREIDWAGPVDLPLSDEHTVQAACGIMHVHGRASGAPVALAVDYASATAGVLCAQGVLATLIARYRGMAVTGVRTSVSQAALLALAQYLAAATADDPPEPIEPGTSAFTCADGRRFELETLEPIRWLDFWTRLGAEPAAVGRGWRAFQQRFATATCPMPDALRAEVRRRPFAVVHGAADAAGVDLMGIRDEPDPPTTARPWTLAPFPDTVSTGLGPTADKPLSGVRVVESTRRVQGPMAGHILRLLGADVVRIEPPGGDPMRGIPPIAGTCSARFSALNAGKTVAEIDIKSAPGRRAVHELVAGADVFLHNWAPGKAAQLQLDADDLRRTSPGLVYAWSSGWGDAFGAASPVGTDFLVQAYTGLAAAVCPADEPPLPSLMTLTDVFGGLICAQGVLAALLDRIRTGQGGRVDSSLFSAATAIPRRARRVEWTPLHRPVRTEDGYLALGQDACPDRLARVLGLGASVGHHEIISRIGTKPTGWWLDRLRDSGVSAMPVCTDLRELAMDPRFGRAIAVDEHAFARTPWEFW